MARRRQSLRKIKEILRLHESGIEKTKIAVITSLTRKTVREYLNRADNANLKYQDINNLSSKEIYAKLFSLNSEQTQHKKTQPDWSWIHQEMKKKNVTLTLLWEEFIQENPRGIRSSQFSYHYNHWKKKLNLSMRQTHKLGEKCFVDYAGHTIPIVDQNTGEIKKAQIFVAILGASNYTYAEATWTQSTQDWTSSHANAFEYFGGVTELVIPDNLRTGINKACRYEPEINKSYHDLAMHYGVAVMPTRIRKPKDKSKVENAVQVVERWILASLRNRTFFSLSELNKAISELLEKLNNKPFKKLPGTRKSIFNEQEKSTLKPLPIKRYEFATWKKAKVNIDYHIEVEGCYYSLPYNYVRENVETQISSSSITVFRNNKYICTHIRSSKKGSFTTKKEHMPKSHQEYLEWTPTRIANWANSIGKNTGILVSKIINSKSHPALGYRSALGVIRLGKKYGNNRLEKACSRAITFGGFYYKSVKSILEKGLDKQPIEKPEKEIPQDHQNIRGSQYFQSENNTQNKEKELCPQTL